MEIIPGIHRINTPLMNNPLGSVNAYLMRSDEGDLLVDSGWNREESFQALQAGLHEAGSSLDDLRVLFVTHSHPDHIGLAARLQDACGAQILCHELTHRHAENTGKRQTRLIQEKHWLQSHGLPDEKLQSLYRHFSHWEDLFPPVRVQRYVQDGEQFRWGGFDLQAIHTPGHAPGHLCLYEPSRKILISGDHILQHISPHIGLFREEGGRPLADYLDSLNRVRELPVELVLPAHGDVFSGLRGRAVQLSEHHESRLLEIKDVVDESGKTAYEIASLISWMAPGTRWGDIQLFQQYMALAETLAHLEELKDRGIIQKTQRAQQVFYHL